MTQSNPLPRFQHPFPHQGAGAAGALHRGELVLLPTANLWQLTCHAGHPGAVHAALACCPPSTDNCPELVFPDVEEIRRWCPRIHPRLETLLSYHRRPLTCLVPAGSGVPLPLIDQRGEVAVRVAADSFVHRLCEDIEHPLVSCLAQGAGAVQIPTRFGVIRSDVLRRAGFVVNRRVQDVLGTRTAVRIRFDEGTGEMEFV